MRKNIIPWNGRLSQLFSDPLLALDAEVGRWFAPSCNIAETKDGYEITMDVPGLKADAIHVEFHDGRLQITGERQFDRDEEGVTYHRVERHYGKFERSFSLPNDVDGDQLDAECKEGVLTIKAPKVAAVQPKRVAVK